MLKVVWSIFLMLLLHPASKQMRVSKGDRELCSPVSRSSVGKPKAESKTWCTLYQLISENEFNHHVPLPWEIPAHSLSKSEQTQFKTYLVEIIQ